MFGEISHIYDMVFFCNRGRRACTAFVLCSLVKCVCVCLCFCACVCVCVCDSRLPAQKVRGTYRSRQLRSGFPRAHHRRPFMSRVRAVPAFFGSSLFGVSQHFVSHLRRNFSGANRARRAWACRAVGGVCLKLRRALSCARCSVAQAGGGQPSITIVRVSTFCVF